MNAKLKSKAHLQNTLFDLLSRFLCDLQVQKIKKGIKKRRISRKSVKKYLKNAPNK
jgi:hypothetical protein